jgi:hypothetical protein
MGLADLHMHTIYNYDGIALVSAVLTRAKQVGSDVIAITGHDEIKGALKALEFAPGYGVEVILGIEITTAEVDAHVRVFPRESISFHRDTIWVPSICKYCLVTKMVLII